MVEGIEARSNFGCRWGHFYSKRLVDEVLGLGEEKGGDGVVRVSMVHYNTGKLFLSLPLLSKPTTVALCPLDYQPQVHPKKGPDS